MNNFGMGGHAAAKGHSDEEVFGKAYDQRVILRLFPYVKPFKKLLIISTIAMLVYTVTLVAVPWIIAWAINDYVIPGNINGLNYVFGLFLLLAFTNWISNYIQQTTMQQVGQGVLWKLRGNLFSHVQKQSMRYFDSTEVGRLMSRVQGDVSQLQEFSSLMVMSLGELLSLVGIIIALFLLNYKLALITLTVLPLLVLLMIVWQKYAKKAFIEVRVRIAIVNAAFNENISGVKVVQSLNRQTKNLDIFSLKNSDHRVANFKASKLAAGLIPGVDILTAVAIALTIVIGAMMVSDSSLEVGTLVGFVMYIQRFFDPIRNLTQQYTQLQRSMASGSRIFDLLDKKPDFEDSNRSISIGEIEGNIEFKNINFSYNSEDVVLRNVNLSIKSGETVAFVGPTGAGKTTLVSILSRFYYLNQNSGDILIDGVNLNDIKIDSLSRQMSMVLQEPFLFSGTIKENIKYNNPGSSDESMYEATKSVGAHDFIMNMDSGYDTLILERGSNVSLGQRQLLSFARAILSNPKILILDEATSSIDSYTELRIQEALKTILKDRTAIIIAHRLSTVRGADRIIVLNDGQIVEDGNHKELMDAKYLYHHLYNMNFSSIES
tara:strand:+ start:4936 stop:6747 length:1812 start_codon:yes stop_codon:yes gene_type:complete